MTKNIRLFLALATLIFFGAAGLGFFSKSQKIELGSIITLAEKFLPEQEKTLQINSAFSDYDTSPFFKNCIYLFPDQKAPITNIETLPLCFSRFAVLYSPQRKTPILTVEKLQGGMIFSDRSNRTEDFHEELRIPFKYRSQLSDYIGSGFDRGHLVPAGDVEQGASIDAMSQTFSLSNIVPQAPQNNRRIWSSSVELAVRKFVGRSDGELYVFTGVSGSKGVIGKNQVTVPLYLWKLVYSPSKQKAWAYWLENSDSAQVSGIISYQELLNRIYQQDQIKFNLQLPMESSHAAK